MALAYGTAKDRKKALKCMKVCGAECCAHDTRGW